MHNLIRRYNLKYPLPYSQIRKLYLKKQTTFAHWNQDFIEDLNVRSALLYNIGIKKLEPSIIVHNIYDEVGTHRDWQSRSVFLFPVKVGKETKLCVENEERVLQIGYMYRFSDFNQHCISNETGASLCLITVSYNAD